VRLTPWQRIHALAIAIIQGFISNFYAQPLKNQYATISQEAWRQCIYANRFELIALPVPSIAVLTEEETKFNAFKEKFEAGALVYETGGRNVAIRSHGVHITPLLLGFVVRHLKENTIENPSSTDITPCLAGSISNAQELASRILGWEVKAPDTAHSLFYRIARGLRELSPPGEIENPEAYSF
jgi:hypothetical protein